MSHGSARLTVHGRRLIVQRHQAGWKQAHIASAMGVSRKCVKTWIDRYAAEGRGRAAHPVLAPPHDAHEDPEQVEQKVLAARAEHREGPDVLGPRVGVAARTVSRILRRHRAPYLRDCDPMTGEVIRSSKATAVRYERQRPGELVHGRQEAGQDPRRRRLARPRQTRANHQARVDRKPVGYDYIHSLVDDHSRLAYCEVLPTSAARPARPSCNGRQPTSRPGHRAHRARDDRQRLRLPQLDRIKRVCADLGATQKFIRPHCPWQNGKVERLNQPWPPRAYRRVFTDNDQRAAALAHGSSTTPMSRRHSALGGQPPISRLQPT